MKVRNIPKQFDTAHNLGYKNLYVSGCSFTYNNSEEHLCTWPYYLRDKGGFENVVDSSLGGAGNYHISNSLIWTLENNNPNPKDTLVIVMWSGNNRDDKIISANNINDYPMTFYYNNDTVSGISGGLLGEGNHICRCDGDIKSSESRAVENFLYITSTYYYLKAKGYRFLFLDFLDRSITNIANDFDIRDFLEQAHVEKLNNMFNQNIENIYKWAVRHNMLDSDDFHPSANGHLSWTTEILLPYLVDNYLNF
jgi:hypothetical protein